MPERSRESAEEQIRGLLAEVFTPEGIEMWMNGRKRRFNGRTPRALIAAGEVARVEDAVHALIAGNF